MEQKLSLFNHDLVREVCRKCGGEKFQFFPKGEEPSPSVCSCGENLELADLSDTSIRRLIVSETGFVVRRN